MILEIFEKNSKERLDLIRTFDFVQYTEEFNDSGTFSIKMPFNDPSLKYLKKNNYILFDEGIMGLIKYIHKESENSTNIEIKGYLTNRLLWYRVVDKTKKYSDYRTNIARSLVNEICINNENENRNIKIISLSEDSKYIPDSLKTVYQNTGDKLIFVLQDLLSVENKGFKLYPVIANYDENIDKPSNVSEFEFRVLKPTYRTIENLEGNSPVVFSMSLNNLSSLKFTDDDSEFCNVAFVAGEGEGQNRKVLEVGKNELSDEDRIETYIDARDLQSDDGQGNVLSEEEYNEALTQRGLERLEEHKSFTSYEGTIIDGNNSYTYGEDFFNGDFVSIIDEDLDVYINLQITKVTKSLTKEGEKLDITFGSEKVTVNKLMKKRGI